MPRRHTTITQKVKTDFGTMHFHIELTPDGGWISSPGKEPESQITMLIEDLSNGLNEALKIAREK